MIITIDIGNTNISFALFKGKKITRQFDVSSTFTQTALRKELRKRLNSLARLRPKVENVIICSVVPKVLKVVDAEISKALKVKARVTGRDIKIPLTNRYRNPRQVGQDRLVCAYAASQLYGKPVIIVDLGTAITIDVVTTTNAYLGGIIVPGIQMSADSLFQKTALLPKIKIDAPKSVIGKDTEASILSGIFHGYGAMITGLITKVSKEISGRPKVVVTGGHTNFMRRHLGSTAHVVDTDLVFKGLKLLLKQ